MFVIGIDLSGPSNHKDTAAAFFELAGEELKLLSLESGLSDAGILKLVQKTNGFPLAIGIDSPLSYNDGGGDRPSDRWFRKEMVKHGLRSSSIMPPTLTKMVYLTMRGISLAALFERVRSDIRIAEVHPGAAMMTRLSDMEKEHGLLYKKSSESRTYLLQWFESQNISGISLEHGLTPHEIDAVAAAMAVRDWIFSAPQAIFPKQPPHHPYDFLC
ncbi:DUF429 domain-containing protein [Metabacillus sp. KIGAM252]|uniref:DUF429 domain-containing protein n=1 Tax=Metabacillus flavus TaxID=2823519 RepID=A0ABS5LB30_9BACI|nr:DUF429 domain-containing protein [Metabacillus flavus]MBS2967743.1 DUF429 domain-containing protein [Metabacillus flavus]